MRRRTYLRLGAAIAAIIPAVAILFFAMGGSVNAQAFRSGNNVGISATETIDSTVFISGRTITIDGTVNGDVFCAGGSVTIAGTVNGDVLCAAQSIRITGTIEGNVRSAAQTLLIDGQVSRNVSAAGQTLTTASGSSIGGDATLGGQDMTLNGSIGRDLIAGSGELIINGAVGRNVRTNVELLTLGNQADITGSVNYNSTNELQRDSGAQVGGDVKRQSPQQAGASESQRFPWLFVLGVFVSLLLLALVLALLAPRILHGTTTYAMRNLGRTFLVGFAASIVVPIIIVGLMFTLIGLPLAILLLLAWLCVLIVSGPFFAYLVGRYILRGRSSNAVWIMLVGALLLLVIYPVPVLGQLTMLVAGWFGIGMVLLQAVKKLSFDYDMPAEPPKVESTAEKRSSK